MLRCLHISAWHLQSITRRRPDVVLWIIVIIIILASPSISAVVRSTAALQRYSCAWKFHRKRRIGPGSLLPGVRNIIIDTMTFMKLSLWLRYCESSPDSFDECRTFTVARPKVSTHFTVPPRIEGWVDPGNLLHTDEFGIHFIHIDCKKWILCMLKLYKVVKIKIFTGKYYNVQGAPIKTTH